MFWVYMVKILCSLAPLSIIGIYSTNGTQSDFVLLLMIGISYTVLLNIPFINTVAFLVAWIWGLVVVVQNFNALLITFYLCMLFINLLFIFSQQKKKKDALKEINKYTSLNIRNEENETTLKKFKKVNNDIIEVDIRNFTDDELMKLRSVLPPKCIHQSDTNNFVAYIFLSECLLSEQIRILNVVQKIENDEYSCTPENTTTDTNLMGRVDISNFSLSDIKRLLEKIPEDRILNNPLEDDVIEIDLKGLPLSERAKIGAAISEIKSKHA